MNSTWSMPSYLPSVIVLGLVALGAVQLTQRRTSADERQPERTTAARALAIATITQGVHFGEEVATGFHDQLPALIGQPGMPLSIFVAFLVLSFVSEGLIQRARGGRLPPHQDPDALSR